MRRYWLNDWRFLTEEDALWRIIIATKFEIVEDHPKKSQLLGVYKVKGGKRKYSEVLGGYLDGRGYFHGTFPIDLCNSTTKKIKTCDSLVVNNGWKEGEAGLGIEIS